MGMVSEMEDKVFFIHHGSAGRSADFFINERIDYYMPDCEYVEKFLEEHPDYVYIGSTDNMHAGGWGMSFKGYTKVECPKLEE